MKKILALTLSLASIGFVASSAEAKAAQSSISPATIIAANSAVPQVRIQIGSGRRNNRRNNRRVRTTTQTRLVRYGRQVYRETYQLMYLPNGRTQTSLISRVRVR
jgi:hypothetical protein